MKLPPIHHGCVAGLAPPQRHLMSMLALLLGVLLALPVDTVGQCPSEDAICSSRVVFGRDQDDIDESSLLQVGKPAHSATPRSASPHTGKRSLGQVMTGERTTPSKGGDADNLGLTLIASSSCMALGLIAFVYVTVQPYRNSIVDRACMLQLCLLFIQHLTYMLIVPSSFTLSKALGQGAAYSGWIIGAHMAGVCAGGVLMWFLFVVDPDAWRGGRALMLCATCLNLVGAGLFCFVTFSAEGSGTDLASSAGMAVVAVVSRVIDGFGAGINVQFGLVSIVHLMASSARTGWMASNQFAVMAAMGLGPILASFMSAASSGFTESAAAPLRSVGVTYVGLAFTVVVVAWSLYPTALESVEDFQPPTPQASSPDQGKPRTLEEQGRAWAKSRILLQCAALVMCGLRGYVVSGLEAATPMLLETDFGWTAANSGYAIGICFLFCIPVKLLFNLLGDRLDVSWMTRSAAAVSMVGAVMLSSKACQVLHMEGSCGALLLLAGCAILFPAIFMGDALTLGLSVMSHNVMPSGSWFDTNMVGLYRLIGLSAIGRTLGPPNARAIIVASGQDGYAFVQLCAALAFLVLLEAFVLPCNARHRDQGPPEAAAGRAAK